MRCASFPNLFKLKPKKKEVEDLKIFVMKAECSLQILKASYLFPVTLEISISLRWLAFKKFMSNFI